MESYVNSFRLLGYSIVYPNNNLLSVDYPDRNLNLKKMISERVNEASEVPCIFLENLIYNSCTWEKVSLNWMPVAGVVATFMLTSFGFYPTLILVLFLSFLFFAYSFFLFYVSNHQSSFLYFMLFPDGLTGFS